ncbi:MAG TPA: PaaI family thioesterase [Kofleriaceae bacterium]
MTKAEIEAFLDAQGFPQARTFAVIEAIRERAIDVTMPFKPFFVRPGGSISGPALMTLADTAAYFLVLAAAGPISTVTSSLEIKFLARPAAGDVRATATLLKHGKRLLVAAVEMRGATGEDLVAYATVTYALPAG